LDSVKSCFEEREGSLLFSRDDEICRNQVHGVIGEKGSPRLGGRFLLSYHVPGKATGRDTVNATISMGTHFLVGTGDTLPGIAGQGGRKCVWRVVLKRGLPRKQIRHSIGRK